MTSLPRRFCPDCARPLEDGQLMHGLHGEHMECYEARLRGEFPSERGSEHGAGRNWSQPLNDAIFDPDWKPVPDKLTGVNATGWLAPDGKFYGCRPYVHIALGDALDEYFHGRSKENPWRRSHGSSVHLEELRWAHVAEHGVYWRTDDRDRGPTQAQLDILFDFFMEVKDLLDEHNRDQRVMLSTLERLFRVNPDEL